MTVAVLMSTYNAEEYLEEQIDSILRQKGDFTIHLYIRDDGSLDSKKKVLKRYESYSNITIIQGENLGPAQSFLALISMINDCDYDFYAFADQDDYWCPLKLKTEINKFIEDDSPQIVFSNAEMVDNELKCLGANLFTYRPVLNLETVYIYASVQGCTMMWNNKLNRIVKECGIPKKIVMHDSFLARVCVAVGGRIEYIDEPLIKYRQHENNVMGASKTVSGKIKNIIKSIMNKDTIGISDQAMEISQLYCKYIPERNLKYIDKIINYRSGITSRIALILNKNISFSAPSIRIIMLVKILMGTR